MFLLDEKMITNIDMRLKNLSDVKLCAEYSAVAFNCSCSGGCDGCAGCSGPSCIGG